MAEVIHFSRASSSTDLRILHLWIGGSPHLIWGGSMIAKQYPPSLIGKARPQYPLTFIVRHVGPYYRFQVTRITGIPWTPPVWDQ